MQILLIIVFLIVLRSVLCASDGKTILLSSLNEYDVAFVPCATKFYLKYVNSSTLYPDSIVQLSILPRTKSNFHNDLIGSLHSLHLKHVKTGLQMWNISSPYKKSSNVWSRTHTYIVIIDKIDDIPEIVEGWHTLKSWNPQAFVFAVLNVSMHRVVTIEKLRYLFRLFLNSQMINVVIIYKNETMVDASTWAPYDGENCADSIDELYPLDRCTSSIQIESENETITIANNEADNLIKIPDNLHQCPLNISASVWVPFVGYINATKEWRGIEVAILKIFAKKFNMTINFLWNYEKRGNRLISNHTGVYSTLLRGCVRFKSLQLFFNYYSFL